MATKKKKKQSSGTRPHALVGKTVLVRDNRAGVLVGTLVAFDAASKSAELKDARKVWYWTGAAAVEGIAARGLNHASSKVSPAVATSVCLDVIQLLECAAAGASSVRNAPEWKP